MSSTTAYEIVNVGTLPNDGEGDPLRVAFQKINNNFANLYSVTPVNSLTYSVGTSPQVIFEYPAANFTHATLQVRSADIDTTASQDITIQAQINNVNTAVKFSAYGTTFFGNAVCSYDMATVAGNVVLYAQSLSNITLQHFITASVTWIGEIVPGSDIALDGYAEGSVLSTENTLVLTTETTV